MKIQTPRPKSKIVENPTVLIFAGLDPSGGAGLSADIETIRHFGLTPLPICTALTAQNTGRIDNIEAVGGKMIENQFEILCADIAFGAVKIGLIRDKNQVATLVRLLSDFDIPIVFDPVILNARKNLPPDADFLKFITQNLTPLATVLTPNQNELEMLSGKSEEKAVGRLGSEWILVTKTDTSEIDIHHRLYHQGVFFRDYSYRKLAHNYHGSGCTLSSAIVALLTLGKKPPDAVEAALDYTYRTLIRAWKIGKMAWHPNRLLNDV